MTPFEVTAISGAFATLAAAVGYAVKHTNGVKDELKEDISEVETRVTVLESSGLLSYEKFHHEMEPLREKINAIAVKVGAIDDRRHEEP